MVKIKAFFSNFLWVFSFLFLGLDDNLNPQKISFLNLKLLRDSSAIALIVFLFLSLVLIISNYVKSAVVLIFFSTIVAVIWFRLFGKVLNLTLQQEKQE